MKRKIDFKSRPTELKTEGIMTEFNNNSNKLKIENYGD